MSSVAATLEPQDLVATARQRARLVTEFPVRLAAD